jgi:hypothetical protein
VIKFNPSSKEKKKKKKKKTPAAQAVAMKSITRACSDSSKHSSTLKTDLPHCALTFK